MGLDCYWLKPNEKKSAPLHFEPGLCFENEHDEALRRNGSAMFRGKTFETIVRQITGESLYVDWMSPRKVRAVAKKLEKYVAKPWPLPPSVAEMAAGWELWTPEQIADIARMFRAYGEAGYGLAGSW